MELTVQWFNVGDGFVSLNDEQVFKYEKYLMRNNSKLYHEEGASLKHFTSHNHMLLQLGSENEVA